MNYNNPEEALAAWDEKHGEDGEKINEPSESNEHSDEKCNCMACQLSDIIGTFEGEKTTVEIVKINGNLNSKVMLPSNHMAAIFTTTSLVQTIALASKLETDEVIDSINQMLKILNQGKVTLKSRE